MSPLVVDPVSLGLVTAISEASHVRFCPGLLSTVVVPVRPVVETISVILVEDFAVVGVACSTFSLLPLRFLVKKR